MPCRSRRISATFSFETVCSFNIVYYSQDRNLLDLTNIEKRLRKSLKKPLKVEYKTSENIDTVKFLDILDVECEPDEYDYILECSIGFEFLHNTDIENPYDDYENNEIMEEIDVKDNKGGIL